MRLLGFSALAWTTAKASSDEVISAPEEIDFANQANIPQTSTESIDSEILEDNNKPEQFPPQHLIFVCEGTAKSLSYCQFPFSTLAGNDYSSTCADKVEDNPDYSVDRPWCFTSATEWGFCDCQGFLDFSYVSGQYGTDHDIRDFKVQIILSHPGTVWCALSQSDTSLPSLQDVITQKVPGGSTDVTIAMVRQDVNGQVEFHANLDIVRTHPFLSCQASVPGLPANPGPVVTKLGTKKDMLEDPTDDLDNTPAKPRLITHTSGALMYSTLIVMILAGFFFYRYAMDRRAKMLSFTRLETDETSKQSLSVVLK